MWWFGRVCARRQTQPLAARRQKRGCKWSRWESRAAAELVRDGEAFLVGSLAERIQSRAGTVPVWAWTNLLAHGTAEGLRSESARAGPGWGAPARPWRQARSYLATEVLHCAEIRRLARRSPEGGPGATGAEARLKRRGSRMEARAVGDDRRDGIDPGAPGRGLLASGGRALSLRGKPSTWPRPTGLAELGALA